MPVAGDATCTNMLVLTNMLIAGSAPDLKNKLNVPVVVTLQGDDVFLESLPASFRTRALSEVRRLADCIDAFLVHSRYYADFMAEYLLLDRDKFHLVPLGIDTSDFQPPAVASPSESAVPRHPRPLRVGYLARLEPEKGLHVLVDAFIALKQMPGMDATELLIAGWLGKRHRAYAESQFEKLHAAGLAAAYRYCGAVDRADKCAMLGQLDVLSVPTVYREPKGLYVLEALAAGVPVVQPSHGAFIELLEATGGGELVSPNDPVALAQALHRLLTDDARHRALGRQGRHAVHTRLNAQVMARQTREVSERIRSQAGT